MEFKVLLDEELGVVNPYELSKDELNWYLAKATAIVHQVIPKEKLAQIHDHVLSSDGLGLCLVKAPMDKDEDMGPTPTDGKAPKGKVTFYDEALQVALSQAALGMQAFTWTSEKGDQLFHTVAPVPGQEHAASNQGSASGWGAHQERAFNRNSDDPTLPAIEVLTLFVHRADPDDLSSTNVMPFKAFDNLPPDHKEALKANEFTFRPPEACRVKGLQKNFTAPVLMQNAHGEPTVCLNVQGMKPQTPRAEAALEALLRSLDENIYEVKSTAGTLLFINNVKCVHTRGTGFKVYGHGKDRWLTRIFLAKNPPARIIEDL